MKFFLIKSREGSYLTSPLATNVPLEYLILLVGDTRQSQLQFGPIIMSLLACVADLRLKMSRDIDKSGLQKSYPYWTPRRQ